MTVARPPIYVALDFSEPHSAESLIEQLDPAACGLKVGKELFTRTGADWVRQRVNQGFSVFLDLKFHDIPHTVEQACRAAVDLGVRLVNVHASGGRAMLAAARRAVPSGQEAPALIAVTVLTSMDQAALSEVGISRSLPDQVAALAQLAAEEGLDGVVCSAWEASRMREIFTQPMPWIVTPGIRPEGSAANDQSRIMTPREALAAGSTELVIGRPITRAPDPAAAVRAILASLSPPKSP